MTIQSWRYCILANRFAGLIAVAFVIVTAGQAECAAPGVKGWEIEQGVDNPSYAVIEPTKTNLNIDVLVLTCDVVRTASILQLQLYLSTDGPLMAKGAKTGLLREDPRAVMAIDGGAFPVTMFFCG
jgi:hypothetical protein